MLSLVWVYWIGSIAGLILAVLALRRIKVSGARGRKMAIAGITLSAIELGLLVLLVAYALHTQPGT